jgi:ABC-type transport system substrate-binding protein
MRRALAYAFDYNTVVNDIFPGSPLVTESIPPNCSGYCPTEGYTTNVEKAKEELKKSSK